VKLHGAKERFQKQHLYIQWEWLKKPEDQRRLEERGWIAKGSEAFEQAKAKAKAKNGKIDLKRKRDDFETKVELSGSGSSTLKTQEEEVPKVKRFTHETGKFSIGGEVGVGVLAWHVHKDAILMSLLGRFRGLSIQGLSYVLDNHGQFFVTKKEDLPQSYVEAKERHKDLYPCSPPPPLPSPLQPPHKKRRRQKKKKSGGTSAEGIDDGTVGSRSASASSGPNKSVYNKKCWKSGEWVEERWWKLGKSPWRLSRAQYLENHAKCARWYNGPTTRIQDIPEDIADQVANKQYIKV
jgi:hypothetical protein